MDLIFIKLGTNKELIKGQKMLKAEFGILALLKFNCISFNMIGRPISFYVSWMIVDILAQGNLCFIQILLYLKYLCDEIILSHSVFAYYNTLPLVTFVFSRDILNNQTLSTRHGQNFCDVKFSYADTGQHRGRLFSKRYVLHWRITTIKTFLTS